LQQLLPLAVLQQPAPHTTSPAAHALPHAPFTQLCPAAQQTPLQQVVQQQRLPQRFSAAHGLQCPLRQISLQH
jgi:hypothetical protein